MQKYFFDVATSSKVYHDFQGKTLCSLEAALQHAELIALDAGCTAGDELVGAQVQIRDITGQLLHSLPVAEADLIAA